MCSAKDGRIAAIYKETANAPKDAQVLDASGCFVCPGFIDPHGHIDGCKRTGMLSLLQGITTTVGGNAAFPRWIRARFCAARRNFRFIRRSWSACARCAKRRA